jgi:hypothetical protein
VDICAVIRWRQSLSSQQGLMHVLEMGASHSLTPTLTGLIIAHMSIYGNNGGVSLPHSPDTLQAILCLKRSCRPFLVSIDEAFMSCKTLKHSLSVGRSTGVGVNSGITVQYRHSSAQRGYHTASNALKKSVQTGFKQG